MDKVNEIFKKIGGWIHSFVLTEDNRMLGILASAVVILLVILAVV